MAKRWFLMKNILALLLLFTLSAYSTESDKNNKIITITFQDNFVTLDPAIGYDWQNTTVIRNIFNGLVTYKPGSAQIIPDLASDYSLSADGLTFTFHLRKGLKFHNQRPVIAADIKYSIERVVQPITNSPGRVFFRAIKGYELVDDGVSKHLSGIKVIDDYTIKFELSHLDATFLHSLTMHFASAVPKEEINKHGNAYFGRNPVGTGAFIFKELIPNSRLLLERNPHYHIKGLPKSDQLQFLTNISPPKALEMFKKGEVDILGDEIPSGDFTHMINDPAYVNQIIEERLQHITCYLSFNTQLPPFNNIKVRKAINMAINKKSIASLTDRRVIQTNQILPPSMPGYSPRYKGYEFNPIKAKKLLAEAGFPRGFETNIYTIATAPNPSISLSIKADLAKINIQANVIALPQKELLILAADVKSGGMVWSGGLSWRSDFPDPSNFYFPILSCTQVGWNWSFYCNNEIEKLALKADSMVFPQQQKQRVKLWSLIFDRIMDDAPWVPIFSSQKFILHSKRIARSEVDAFNSVISTVDYKYLALRHGK